MKLPCKNIKHYKQTDNDHFSWQTDRQTLHHNIYIIIIILIIITNHRVCHFCHYNQTDHQHHRHNHHHHHNLDSKASRLMVKRFSYIRNTLTWDVNGKLQGNGMIVVPKTGHGERGLYQCKDGYVLKVNKNIARGKMDPRVERLCQRFCSNNYKRLRYNSKLLLNHPNLLPKQ